MQFTNLQQAGALDFFSDYGKAIFNPTGIFYWSGRAKKEARINATIGSAKGRARDVFDGGGDEKITLCIPALGEPFQGMGVEEIFPYAPEVGVPAFREAWKNWLLKKAGSEAERLEKQIHLPMVVPGITGAISLSTRMFVNPDERIVAPDKRWENYDNIFLRNIGIEVEAFPTFQGREFNLDGFIQAIHNVWKSQHTAAAIVNFPNNPTGYCPPKDAAQHMVQAIHELTQTGGGKKLVLLFDDAYEGFVYDEGAEMGSLFYHVQPSEHLLPVKLDGVSKELLWYGARIGAITLAIPDSWKSKAEPEALANEIENKFRGMVRNTVSNCNMAAQQGALKALQNLDRVLNDRQKTIDVLKERYRLMQNELGKLKTDVLHPDPFHGGFFCFVNINPKSGLKASAVCDHLLTRYQVGTVPIEAGQINGIRLAFCSVEKEDIPALCQSLESAVNDLLQG